MAAVLACGREAALSHGAAASLWRLLPPVGGPVDVAVAGRAGRKRQDRIRIHRPRSLPPADVTTRHRIPVTAPARTLADLRTVAPPWQWRKDVRQAEFLRLPLSGPRVPGPPLHRSPNPHHPALVVADLGEVLTASEETHP